MTDFIRKKGEYNFTIKVKESGNYVGSGDTTVCSGSFEVTAEPHSISFAYPEKSNTIPEDIASRFSWTANDEIESLEKNEAGLSVATVDTKVILRWAHTTVDEEYAITGLTLSYTEDGVNVTKELERGEDGSFTFEMPDADVTIQVSVNGASAPIEPVDPGTGDPINPEPDFPGEIGDDTRFGQAVAVVAGGAAVGGAAYLIGTQVYLTNVFGSVPANRQELALALWNKAGKPEPQSTVLYTDISAEAVDSQKAARWCVEQGLLKDSGETFKPQRYVTRIHSIKAWNDAKEKGLVK